MQILRPSSPFAPSLPPLPFVVSLQLDEKKAPIKAADRRSRNPRAERRITCEARRRGYVSVSEKPVDHLRGSVKLEIICPFPSTIPGCLAIIGEHRRERASRKSQPEPRKGPKRTRANGGGEQEGNREREREKNRRRRREREFKEREREKRGEWRRWRIVREERKRKGEEKEEKRGKISWISWSMRVCSSMHGVKTCPSWKATGRCPVMVVEDFTVLRVSLWDVPRQFTAAYTVPLRRIVNKTTRRGTHAAELLRHFFSLSFFSSPSFSFFLFFLFLFFFFFFFFRCCSLCVGVVNFWSTAVRVFFVRLATWPVRPDFFETPFPSSRWEFGLEHVCYFFSFKKQIKQERIISIFRVIFMFFNFEIFLGDN